MKSWKASMLVCDDVLVALNGKFNLLGVYTSDLGVPTEPTLANQLVFFLIIEGDLEDRPSSIAMELTFPSGEKREMEWPTPLPPGPPLPDRKKWHIRVPFLVQHINLTVGRIDAKIKHNGQELAVQAPWITRAVPVPSPRATVS